ncbi:MAG: hypothetical protein KZQ83_13010, partial [gamma proteobacterium symbiont of Taylorina sp.]|nr:hypothetical protein [gamma proteobacterium symbiont of Taylorina sp.]
MDKLNTGWNQLNGNIKSCSLCEGLNSVKLETLNAPGYGDINSKLVFIGQSLCGKPCIKSQIPFTGGSGKLLDQAFQKAGDRVKTDRRDAMGLARLSRSGELTGVW